MPNQPKRSITVASVNCPTIRKAVVATMPILGPGDRDREDDHDAHHAAEEHPLRARESLAETADAPARDEEDDERQGGADEHGARQRLEAADAVAEPSLGGDLHRPAEAGDERERGCNSGRAHGGDATRLAAGVSLAPAVVPR